MSKTTRPVKVLQYGQGNFLRAFADDFIQTLNDETDFDGNVVIIKPTNRGSLDVFKQQNHRYHVVIRGLSQGKTVNQVKKISSITDSLSPYTEYDAYMSYAKSDTLRFIISNTTEAGIGYHEKDTIHMTPPESFPGKLTQFLYTRYFHFHGDRSKGLIILPTELIDDNGTTLKGIVHKLAEEWDLDKDFSLWLDEACIFANTLVDRIVSGFPKKNPEQFWKQIGCEDPLLVTAEPFGLWVIEADDSVKNELLPGHVGLPIIFTDDYKPYKERKVRLLNGAHTASALLAYSCGKQYVKDMLDDTHLKTFITTVLFDEIIPALSIPEEISKPFAQNVLERFANPYIDHSLLSISLNSTSKWKARCLPSLRDYMKKFHSVPPMLLFSLVALLYFYQTGITSQQYEIKDDDEVLSFFENHKNDDCDTLVEAFLACPSLHGLSREERILIRLPLIYYFRRMKETGPYAALQEVLREEIH